MASLIWTNEDSGELVLFAFDATTSEDPSDAVTITDHPVEEGVNIVDHARPEPEHITLEGVITDTPHHGNLGNSDDDSSFTDQTVTLSVEGMGEPGTQTVALDVPDPPLGFSPSGLIDAGIGAIGNAIFGSPSNQATAWDPAARKTTSAQAKVLKSSSPVSRSRRAYQSILDAKDTAALITVNTSHREYFDMLIERIGAPVTAEDGDGLRFSIDLRKLRIAESQTVQSPQPTEARGATAKSMGSQTAKPDPNEKAKLDSVGFGLDPTNPP